MKIESLLSPPGGAPPHVIQLVGPERRIVVTAFKSKEAFNNFEKLGPFIADRKARYELLAAQEQPVVTDFYVDYENDLITRRERQPDGKLKVVESWPKKPLWDTATAPVLHAEDSKEVRTKTN